jgi:glycerol kinase
MNSWSIVVGAVERDKGTSGSRTIEKPKAVMASIRELPVPGRSSLCPRQPTVLGAAQESFPQYYPESGWVEHNPEDIWQTQLRCAQLALEQAGLTAADLAGIGIANQRETVLLWDAGTGVSLGNAIVWQCRRTADRCEELKQAGLEAVVQARAGLRLAPYFSATKIEWLLAIRDGAPDRNSNTARSRAQSK